MIDDKHFSGCERLDIREHVHLSPWPHLVLDNFFTEKYLGLCQRELFEDFPELTLDTRGDGRIEFGLIQSRAIWAAVYSAEMKSILESAFQLALSFNKQNLLQIRRMNDFTPPFPLHNDAILGSDSIVCFIYLSPDWHPAAGGRLGLHGRSKTNTPRLFIDPLRNRLVAFRTLADHWHSVERVKGWERLSILSVWDVTDV